MSVHDEPRPGKPRTISDHDVERVIVKTLEESPRDATHRSTRSMAKATGMSQPAISRIWRAFGLKKSQIQALDRSAPLLPLLPGTPARMSHDKRHGTTNLYAALDVASGNVIADLSARHRAEEFRLS